MDNLIPQAFDYILDTFSGKRIYLTAPYRKDIHFRIDVISFITAEFIANKQAIYSPIVQTHYCLRRYKSLTEHLEILQKNYANLLEHWAEVLIIADVKGWEDSTRVQAEYNHALLHNIPVKLLSIISIMPWGHFDYKRSLI